MKKRNDSINIVYSMKRPCEEEGNICNMKRRESMTKEEESKEEMKIIN